MWCFDCGSQHLKRKPWVHPTTRFLEFSLLAGTSLPSGGELDNYLQLVMASGCRRQWHPTPVLLPGKSHGRRILVGCSPRGHWESDTTERLHFDFSLSCIGEGNGNPLQYSCLENPRDGEAWGTAVYGVAQSRTRLKQLSSSSSSMASGSGFLCAALSLQLCLTLFDPMDVAHQAPLSMRFSSQGSQSRLPCPPPRDLRDPGI